MKFGDRAVVLAGMSSQLLGWRPDEFWQATPAELAAAFCDDRVEQVAAAELQQLREQFPDG